MVSVSHFTLGLSFHPGHGADKEILMETHLARF